MKVTYDFTPEEYTRLNQYFVKHDPDTQRKKRRSVWAVPAIYLILGLVWLAMGDVGFLIGMLIVALAWLCLYPLYWDYCTRRRLQKAVTEAREIGYFGAHEVTIAASGITAETPRAKTEIKWSGISKIMPAEPGIFIHTTSTTAILVPNSAFTAQNTREQFLEEMMRYREQAAGLTEML